MECNGEVVTGAGSPSGCPHVVLFTHLSPIVEIRASKALACAEAS